MEAAREPQPLTERGFILLLLFLTLVGVVVRAVHLDSTLGHDEAVTVEHFVEGGLTSIFAVYEGYGSTNNHVLNSLSAFLSVSVFGLHVWALRLPAFVFGVLTIPLFGVVVRRLLGDRLVAGVASLLATLSPILVAYSPACRGYAPLLFFVLSATWLVLRALDHGGLGKLLLLALTLFAVGWSHMSGLIFVGTCGLVVLLLLALSTRRADVLPKGRRPALAVLGAITLSTVALVLWYSRGSLILEDVQSRLVHGKFVDPSLTGLKSVHQGDTLLPWVKHMGNTFLGTSGRRLVLALPVVFLGMPVVLRRNLRGGFIVLCAALIPPVTLLAGHLKPYPRYFLFVQPFLLVLAAAGLCWLASLFVRGTAAVRARRLPVVTLVLALGYLNLSYPSLSYILRAPGAKEMGIAWDIKGAVDHLAARIGPDDVVLSFPRPRVRGEWNEWAFDEVFACHERMQLAPLLSRPAGDPGPVRRVWYVTPNREIRNEDPLPLGFEPELVAEFLGCSVYFDEVELPPPASRPAPAFDMEGEGLGDWTVRNHLASIEVRLEVSSAEPEASRVSLVVERTGTDSELASRPVPVTPGRLVELQTRVAADQSGGLRPLGGAGFHFYDDAGERVSSVSRTAMVWDRSRPRTEESLLRLTTVVPRSARTMELFFTVVRGNHGGSVIHFRPPRLLGG